MSNVKFGSFLTGLLKKAGVPFDATDAKYADLLSVDVQIPNDLVRQINQNLMTVEAAIENDDVADRIRASALGAIDKDIAKLLDKHELTDLKETLKTEKSTRKKLEQVLEAVEGKLSKKGNASDEDTQKEITRLNNELKKLRTDNETALLSKDAEHSSQLNELMLELSLSGYQYADNPLGKEFVTRFAKEKVLSDIAAQKGKLVMDGKTLKIVKAENGGDLFDNQNNKVELKGLIEGVLSTNKLLQITDPNPPRKDTIEFPGGGGGQANTEAMGALSKAFEQVTQQVQ